MKFQAHLFANVLLVWMGNKMPFKVTESGIMVDSRRPLRNVLLLCNFIGPFMKIISLSVE